MILADPRNPLAIEAARELEARLPDGLPDPALRVVLGGDGFLLHTIQNHGFEHVYLGLNAGHVGFLLNDVTDWTEAAHRIRRGAWTESAFPLIEGEAITEAGDKVHLEAINDVYFERASGQTARLRVDVDGTTVVDSLVADGLIVATALGSSAYSFSAGGAACHPTLRILCLTAICPHQPKLAPIVLPADSRVHVAVQQHQKRPVRAVADGVEVAHVTDVRVRTSARAVRIAHLEGHDHTERLIRKIVMP